MIFSLRLNTNLAQHHGPEFLRHAPVDLRVVCGRQAEPIQARQGGGLDSTDEEEPSRLSGDLRIKPDTVQRVPHSICCTHPLDDLEVVASAGRVDGPQIPVSPQYLVLRRLLHIMAISPHAA